MVGVSMALFFLMLTDVPRARSILGGVGFGFSWLVFLLLNRRIHWVYAEMIRLAEAVTREALLLARNRVSSDEAVTRLAGMTAGWREALLVAKRRLRDPHDADTNRAYLLVSQALRATRWPRRSRSAS